MKKAIAMLLATVMCTAMLTGCGSDSAANESSQASESSVAETAAATTTEAYYTVAHGGNYIRYVQKHFIFTVI